MKRNVYDCDRCKAKDIEPVSFALGIGKQENPAEGTTETEYREFHLCRSCAAVLIARLADRLFKTPEQCRKWLHLYEVIEE